MTKEQIRKECCQLMKEKENLKRKLNAEINYGCALFNILKNGIIPALENTKEEYNKAVDEHLQRWRENQ